MDKNLRDRLVGGLGSGGGTLIGLPIVIYAVNHSYVTMLWWIYFPMELLGIILVSIAVYLNVKKVT
jgi:hypothetical protein